MSVCSNSCFLLIITLMEIEIQFISLTLSYFQIWNFWKMIVCLDSKTLWLIFLLYLYLFLDFGFSIRYEWRFDRCWHGSLSCLSFKDKNVRIICHANIQLILVFFDRKKSLAILMFVSLKSSWHLLTKIVYVRLLL